MGFQAELFGGVKGDGRTHILKCEREERKQMKKRILVCVFFFFFSILPYKLILGKKAFEMLPALKQ